MNWYIEVLKKYAVFSGRSQRKEYWYFLLFNLIALILFVSIDAAIGTFNVETGTGIISTIYMLAVLLPYFGVGIRRLHDTNRSGWWLLIGFIPIVGPIVLIVFFCLDSDPDENKYGENPKTIISA
ncbi:MAG: DUF805 domain-containing protein [Pseudomonadales bacterium]|nr:DUF805 domain-containing protein [Pseudomonadales bacterium]